jgi:general secretion pathway protein F
MAHFKYRAISAEGKVTRGEIEHDSVERAAAQLARQGLTPVSIEPLAAGASRGGADALARLFSRRRGSQNAIAEFTRELAIMLSSSVPLDRSLAVLQGLATDARLKEIIGAISKKVRTGGTLADAFREQPEFSDFFVNMIRAGESSGSLEATLTRLAEHMERTKALKSTVSSALMYPAILLLVASGSLIILLGFVVPKFADMFDEMGGTLPLPTRVVMAAGNWVGSYWWLLVLLIGAAVAGVMNLLAKPEFRERLDRKLLNIPLTGDLVRKVETARLAHTLGTLLAGGVVLVNALSIALATVGNRTLRADLEQGVAALKEGKLLSNALIENSHFPPLAMHMIQVGEETGQLEPILLKVASIYDEEVSGAVKRLLALLEPVLILGLGVLIAGIIVSIMVGIMSVNELVY